MPRINPWRLENPCGCRVWGMHTSPSLLQFQNKDTFPPTLPTFRYTHTHTHTYTHVHTHTHTYTHTLMALPSPARPGAGAGAGRRPESQRGSPSPAALNSLIRSPSAPEPSGAEPGSSHTPPLSPGWRRGWERREARGCSRPGHSRRSHQTC